ncbi:hypothetical protein [Millisia brevis]|uniref:hypothetical protein n=1 Tax=Millisia brevis TaxID=264148 RepID=UPI001C3F2CF2|nr:hypothetical protein [Millisia brevis]
MSVQGSNVTSGKVGVVEVAMAGELSECSVAAEPEMVGVPQPASTQMANAIAGAARRLFIWIRCPD